MFPGGRGAADWTVRRSAGGKDQPTRRATARISVGNQILVCNVFSRQSTVWPALAALASILRVDISNPGSDAPTLGFGRF